MSRAVGLRRMLAPEQIAIVGGDDAAIVIEQCRSFGYEGAIWAVNSSRERLGGERCFGDISDLPAAPDLVFVGVSKIATLPLVERLSKLGAGGAICFAAGFAESGKEGRLQQELLVEAANGMPLLGPNCYGMIDSGRRLAMWPYFHGCKSTQRGVALISQSGMLATSLTMNRRSVEFSRVISIGNQAILGAEDFIEVLSDDPGVTAFALYLEGLKHPSRFVEAVAKAGRRGKPVVMLRSGSAGESGEIARHHTGSDPNTIDGLLDRLSESGIIRVDTPSQMLETLKLVSHPVLPRGLRLAAFTCSGGDAALVSNLAAANGVLLPQPGKQTSSALGSLLPDVATVFNPLDCTTLLWGKPEINRVFSTLVADAYDVAMFIQDYPRPDIPFDPATDFAEARAFIDAARERGIPAIVCSTLPENIHERARRFLLDNGAVPLQGVEEAMSAIVHAFQHRISQVQSGKSAIAE